LQESLPSLSGWRNELKNQFISGGMGGFLLKLKRKVFG
jgi:hypothetical protein